MRHKSEFIVGIDEAGRGPLAGPVAIGAVVIPTSFRWTRIPGVNDSKQVTPKNREAIFRQARELKRIGALDYAVKLIPASVIDRIGITKAIERGITECCKKLSLNPEHTTIKLDGLLKAPVQYRNQKTIIGGDAKERVIGLASILAKVTRDHHMERLGEKYPEYGFEVHKGYGTKLHRSVLKKHGLSGVHRKTFCTRVLASKGRQG